MELCDHIMLYSGHFCVWLLSFGITSSGIIHVLACVNASFFLIAEEHSIVWLDHKLFVLPSADERLGCYEQSCHEHSCAGFCVDACFRSFGCLPRCGAAGSQGISMFNLLGN